MNPKEYRAGLSGYADDSEVTVLSWSGTVLTLQIKMASRGGELWHCSCGNVVHVDMPASIMLGNVAFGGADLLPQRYLTNRNRGYEGDEDTYHVIRFTDNDDNLYFVVTYEPEKWSTPNEST